MDFIFSGSFSLGRRGSNYYFLFPFYIYKEVKRKSLMWVGKSFKNYCCVYLSVKKYGSENNVELFYQNSRFLENIRRHNIFP